MRMRAAIYARISRDRAGAGVGVQRQRDECEELAASHGWNVVHFLADNDLSAYSGKPRPGYRELLRLISDDQVDVVICWHTDRLHRSPVDLEEYIDTCNLRGVATFSKQAGRLDLSTPSGRMVARQLGAVARYESELRSERVTSAKRKLAISGQWAGGRRPFGWEDKGVALVKSEAVAIENASRDVLRGVSLVSIARQWNAEGILTTTGRRWIPQAVRDVLLRPRNAGLLQYRGVVIGSGNWESIVAPELWHAVRRFLTDPDRRVSPGTKPKYLGAMRYRCGARMPDGTECGYPMKVTKGGRPPKQIYCCTRDPKQGVPHVTVNRVHIDDFVVSKLLAGMTEQGFTTTDPATVAETPDMSDLDSAQAALADELAAGRLPVAAYTAANAQLAQRREELEAQAAAAVAAGESAHYLGEFELDPVGTWNAMTLDEQRAILDRHLRVIVTPAPSRSRHCHVSQRVRLEWDWSPE